MSADTLFRTNNIPASGSNTIAGGSHAQGFIRVAAAVPQVTIADVETNVNSIISSLEELEKRNKNSGFPRTMRYRVYLRRSVSPVRAS